MISRFGTCVLRISNCCSNQPTLNRRVARGAVYIRRDEPGIEVWHSPERRNERQRQKELEKSDGVVDSGFHQARLGAHAHAHATKILVEWLKSRNNSPEDYHWVCMRTAG